MAARGFGFLGWNTRFRGNEAHFLLDHALAEIGVGVRWLREQAGVERVVLLGNSGGGSLMAAYQSQAVEPNVTPVAGMRPLPALEALPAGDLYVALAAHSGRPEVLTAWLDPSVTDETDPLSADPALDPFNPGNGPPFSAGFSAATGPRSGRATSASPTGRWPAGRAGRGRGPGTGCSRVSRTWADLRMIDPAIEPSDRRPNRCYLGDPRKANYGVFGVGTVSTLRTWLSMWSLRTSQCRGAAPGPDHPAVPGRARDGRHLRLRERRPRPVRRARRRRTRHWSSSRPTTTSRARRRPRARPPT